LDERSISLESKRDFFTRHMLLKDECISIYSVIRPICLSLHYCTTTVINETGLPLINLRSTTHECVHLVTRGHFRSHHYIRHSRTRNSSEDEIANVNFLYDDIGHALQNTTDSCINSTRDGRGYVLDRRFTKVSEITQCNGHYAVQGHSGSPILVEFWWNFVFLGHVGFNFGIVC